MSHRNQRQLIGKRIVSVFCQINQKCEKINQKDAGGKSVCVIFFATPFTYKIFSKQSMTRKHPLRRNALAFITISSFTSVRPFILFVLSRLPYLVTSHHISCSSCSRIIYKMLSIKVAKYELRVKNMHSRSPSDTQGP